jgi:hypothetical protein
MVNKPITFTLIKVKESDQRAMIVLGNSLNKEKLEMFLPYGSLPRSYEEKKSIFEMLIGGMLKVFSDPQIPFGMVDYRVNYGDKSMSLSSVRKSSSLEVNIFFMDITNVVPMEKEEIDFFKDLLTHPEGTYRINPVDKEN